MMNTMDLADAIADEMAEQRQAMLDRCGITVAPWSWPGAEWDTSTLYAVMQDNQILNTFRALDEAYQFAGELAGEAIDAGDLHG